MSQFARTFAVTAAGLCCALSSQNTFAQQSVQAAAASHWLSNSREHAIDSEAGRTLRPTADSLRPAHGGQVVRFPALPPDPHAQQQPALPPLEEELWFHGGSYLYQPEGDRLNWPSPCDTHQHYDLLRLPEDWIAPQPLTAFSDFLGADPIYTRPWLKWPGPTGYMWDLRFVGAGGYDLFAFTFRQNDQDQTAIGHQLLVDLDLRLTGTERFHVQFRPLGKDGSGGSYYQFDAPSGYVDNSTAEPARYWFEGELQSILGSYLDPFAVRDVNFVVGKWALALQNGLLINDELLAFAVGKNSIYASDWSNLNLQGIYAFNDVDTFGTSSNQLWAANAMIDYQRTFTELTYGYLQSIDVPNRYSHYAAFSHTRFFGPTSLAGRVLTKWGNERSGGNGQLFVVESNHTSEFPHHPFGIKKGVYYGNIFYATRGWSPISGGNFNRLRVTFETNPLIRVAAGLPTDDIMGAAVGVQLFRHHADESFIPELAFELQQGAPVWGLGCRYLRKVGPRSYIECLATAATSDDARFDRAGVFLTHHIVF